MLNFLNFIMPPARKSSLVHSTSQLWASFTLYKYVYNFLVLIVTPNAWYIISIK